MAATVDIGVRSDEAKPGAGSGENPQNDGAERAHGADEVCGCLSTKLQAGIGRGISGYARFASQRPCLSVVGSVLFVLVCAPGLAILERDASSMLFYQRAAYTSRAYIRHAGLFTYDPENTGVFLLFDPKPGKKLFDPVVLVEMGRAVDQVIDNVKTEAGQKFAEVCEDSFRGKCEVDSLFHYFEDVAPQYNISIGSQGDLGKVEHLATQLADACFGDIELCRRLLLPVDGALFAKQPGTRLSDSIDIVSVQVILNLDPLKEDSTGAKSNAMYQKAVLEYMHGPTYAFEDSALQTENFHVLNFSAEATEVEGARPGTNDGHLMAISFLLILVFVICSTFAPRGSGPRCRVLLGLSCMLVVLLALVCAIGICGYCHVPLTSLTVLIIFTLFGVSVDDIIVIVHTYDRLPGTSTIENVPERIAESLQTSGSAITLTSATSLAAFLVTSTLDLPAIRYFCICGAFGMLSVYILQITLFVPLFIMDEKRRVSRRRECCLSTCFGSAVPLGGDDDGSDDRKSNASAVLSVVTAASVGSGCGLVQKFAKFMSTQRMSQYVLAIAFMAVLGGSVYVASTASTDADLTGYYVDDSFIIQYFHVRHSYWEARAPYYLAIEHQDEGMFSDNREADIQSLVDDLAALDCVFPPYENWLKDFDSYLQSTHPVDLAAERARLQGDALAFGAKVAEFLDAAPFDNGHGHVIVPWQQKKNVVLKDGKVKSSRIVLQYEADFRSQARYIDNFKRTYRLVFPNGDGENFEGPRVPHTFGIAPSIQRAAERDDIMLTLILESLATACVTVVAVVMTLLNPFVGIFVGFIVLALDTMVIAALTLYGSKLDFVAFLCLSMTIGLVVDYSTHTAHAYLHANGAADEKLYTAVSTMGSSVLSGGGSTMLGICALAGGSSEGFRSFFRVLSTAVGLGTFVGIVVSPVLMRCIHTAGQVVLGLVVKPQPLPSKDGARDGEADI